jgi:hypothetical protein
MGGKGLEFIGPASVMIAFFIAVFSIVKVIVENRTRRMLIEKGMADEKVKFLFADVPEQRRLSSLKWGFVLIGLGIALIIGQFLPYRDSDQVTFALMLLFAGTGFVLYAFMMQRHLKKANTSGSEV